MMNYFQESKPLFKDKDSNELKWVYFSTMFQEDHEKKKKAVETAWRALATLKHETFSQATWVRVRKTNCFDCVWMAQSDRRQLHNARDRSSIPREAFFFFFFLGAPGELIIIVLWNQLRWLSCSALCSDIERHQWRIESFALINSSCCRKLCFHISFFQALSRGKRSAAIFFLSYSVSFDQ